MRRIVCLLLAWLAVAVSVPAAGLIIVHDETFWLPPPHPGPIPPPRRLPPPRPPTWAPMENVFTKADIRVRDQIATTRVEQEFYNANARQLEGTFLFPVPKGAHISKFIMEINGKPVEAELLAADKARGIYEDIVRKLQDPALLEYAGRDLFKVRIFPIEPHARKRITLSYSQLLKADGGLVSLVFPLNTERHSARPIKNLSVKVDLETKRPLKSVYSPSHKVEVTRRGATQATVGYEAADVKPDTDFQLFYAQEDGDIGLSLLTHKSPDEDGYFLLLASPGAQVKNTRVIPKDVAFVLDTSGSMAGAKLEQAKKALAFCVENLNEGDRFEILRFATEVEPLFNGLTDVTREQRARAQNFIKDLKPLGGTAIDDALKKVMALRPVKGDRPFVVIFLTDGRPTVGVTDENAILAGVTRAGAGNVRVFCFGIGTDVNTHLLDKITEETRASSQYVLPEEDIEVKVSNFFSKIKEPVLAGPKLVFPDGVRVTKLYPTALPDLFKGEQLVLAGRYSGSGDGAIRLEGTVNGEAKLFAYDEKFPAQAADHEFIPRLWATRRVGYLLDEIRLRGENAELKEEVTELARKYGIVTPYTAYLIVEDESRRGLAGNVRTVQFTNLVQEREAGALYRRARLEQSGDSAVAGARANQALKLADTPGEAIVQGNADAFRAAPALASRSPAGSASGPALAWSLDSKARLAQAQQDSGQSRFVAGRTFFQNQNQWVDSEAQRLKDQKPRRIEFNSPEYFELWRKEPRAQTWLALGRNVQFVLDGQLYEIYEAVN